MAKLSDQMRKAIETSGTSRYALAKQVGVSESALSRFMAGKRGLTLATLDKLAEILGLEFATTVQRVQRTSPTGPKKKVKPMAKKQTKLEWHYIAVCLAEDAHENNFPSRRGVWYLEGMNVLCFYNNNPYARFPDLRAQEVAEFRKRLKGASIKELGYATYPRVGKEEAGYTFAMIVDASLDREIELCDWWTDILSASGERMKRER